MASQGPSIGTLSSIPEVGQIVRHGDKEYETVKEGLAYILVPRQSTSSSEKERKNRPTEDKDRPAVFYNPIQQFNRDLSVLAIRAYGEHAIAMKTEKHEKKLKRRDSHCKGKKRKREALDGDTGTGSKKSCVDERSDIPAPAVSEVAPSVAEQEQPNAAENNETPWTPSFTILDALSATGLRALRYAKEIPFATQVVANDLSALAIASMKNNIKHNRVDDIVRPNNGDACSYMYSILGPQKPHKDGSYFGKFDVVDLDPYGTAAPFMDAAVQAVTDGGMLCVTCTDAGVFAATGYPEKAYALYGGIPIKGVHSHEGGLRLILHALATSAAKYGIAIEPLLSLSIDFYARLFVRVHRSPSEVKFTAGKSMVVYNCDSGCGAWSTQRLSYTRQKEGKNGNPFYVYRLSQAPIASPNCEHCGFRTHLAGPMWAGPLHNPHFVQRILDLLGGADRETYPTFGRIEGMLTTALEEDLNLGGSSREPTPEPESSTNDLDSNTAPSLLIPRVDPAQIEPYPFFFITSAISKVLHTQTMPENSLRGALRHLGYKSTRSHAKPGSIRTDAPWSVIWEIMREWVRQKSPVKEGAINGGSPGEGIMRRGREKLGIDGEGAGLRSLKRDILSAVEAGKDLSDLTTKIEAALYRSGVCRLRTEKTGPENGEQGSITNKTGESSLERPDPSTLDIVFDESLGRKAMDAHHKKRLIRYQTNPRPNWGPLARAPVTSAKKD
ncbi:RNA methyltransferase tRNA(m5U54)methyltransferase [Coccidioides posadasii str. Silveira]|uniref:tRNA (guanine(26)-N(2))-dimethyltransferase n=1 Tax=Coccidioides posadasii (strain RMSCC 757 / Silveira) TaxID=443226 RepID=E9DEI2_COCPS|nr:N2,N2-dimethylguanosine tRNA methyltransferase [Coccidioides posadasii str. Silveira]QVM09930.1 RNA methyltransferase tRNA(m5U54)methyltransferase [Coccidioides posadasii str. Silveira]